MSNVHVVMVLGYFISCMLIYSLFLDAVMSKMSLLKLFFVLAAISFLIPIKLYRKWLTMSMYEYVFFNILGLTTISCALFFVLNASFKGQPYEESYKIVNIERQGKAFLFDLEHDQYKEEEYLRTIRDKDPYYRNGNEFFSITFSDGLFGVRIVENKRLH